MAKNKSSIKVNKAKKPVEPETLEVKAEAKTKSVEVKKDLVATEEKPKKRVCKKPAKKEVKEELKVQEPVAEAKPEVKEEAVEVKEKPKKAAAKKKAPAKKEVKAQTEEVKAEPVAEVKAEPVEVKVEPAVEEIKAEPVEASEEVAEEIKEEPVTEYYSPRRSIAFIGSECYPFVKTGGLGDVMYALPKELVKQNCDVRVIIPRYKCIKPKWQEKMVYKGAFQMDLCSDGRSYYVGIMEYIEDGVVYDFIDNEEFFSSGNPYTTIVDDIPKYCYFGKAALAALNYLNWIPNIIHCHDWQAALVPIYQELCLLNHQLVLQNQF